MASDNRSEAKDLNADLLFSFLTNLPGDIEADSELGRRNCCRWLLRAPAELFCVSPDGTETRQYVSIRDVSITGICLLCKTPVSADTTAELLLPMEDGYYKVMVRVSHCTQTVGGWRVGCRLLLADAVTLVPMANQPAQLDRDTFERQGR